MHTLLPPSLYFPAWFIYTRDLKLWMFMMCIPAASFRLLRFILQITISNYSLLNNEEFRHFRIWTFASKNLDDKASLSNFQWSSDLPAVWQTCFHGRVIITKLGRVNFVLYACTYFLRQQLKYIVLRKLVFCWITRDWGSKCSLFFSRKKAIWVTSEFSTV